MSESLAHIVSSIFFYGILATPLLAFIAVRKSSTTIVWKIVQGLAIVILLSVIFLIIGVIFFTKQPSY